MIHELKILPEYFEPVLRESKTFELRKADRDFQLGDCLALNEWSEEDGYTGRALLAQVVYILNPNEVATCAPGYVILGIELVGVTGLLGGVGNEPMYLLGRWEVPTNG